MDTTSRDTVHIKDLPDSIIIFIFSFLELEELRLVIQLVCVDWRILSHDRDLWRHFSFERTLMSDASLRTLLSCVGHGIEVLDLDGVHGLSDQSLLTVAEHCHNITEIKWLDMPLDDTPAESLGQFVASCPHLSRYEFSAKISCYPSILELCTGQLTALLAADDINRSTLDTEYAGSNDEILPTSLVEIASKNPGIRRLKSNGFGSGDYLAQFCSKCPHLDTLSIHNATWISGETLVEACTSLRFLTSLDISATLVDDKCLCQVAELCPYLDTVDISACRKITDMGIIRLAERCSSITSIRINNNRYVPGNITDVGLTDLVTCLPRLRVLYISFCPSVTPVGVHSVAEYCRDLEEIHVEGCVALTDAAFLALAQHCKQLHIVNASHCLQLRSPAVQEMLCTLPKLHTLHIESCRSVSDIHFRHCQPNLSSPGRDIRDDVAMNGLTIHEYNSDVVTRDQSSKLTNVSFNFCSQLKPSALTSLAMFCPRLQSVNLTACSELTDSSLDTLTRECKDLRFLDLASGSLFRRYSNLSDRTLHSISRNCVKLEELHLKMSFPITMDGLRPVVSRCVSLVVISLTLSKQLPFIDVMNAIEMYRGQCLILDTMGRRSYCNDHSCTKNLTDTHTFMMPPIRVISI